MRAWILRGGDKGDRGDAATYTLLFSLLLTTYSRSYGTALLAWGVLGIPFIPSIPSQIGRVTVKSERCRRGDGIDSARLTTVSRSPGLLVVQTSSFDMEKLAVSHRSMITEGTEGTEPLFLLQRQRTRLRLITGKQVPLVPLVP
jgi:hypothetical protein